LADNKNNSNTKNTTKNKAPASQSLMPKGTKKSSAKSTQATGKAQAQKADRAETASAKPKETKKAPKEQKNDQCVLDENSMLFNLLPYLLGFAGVFTAFCIGFPEQTGFFGSVTYFLRQLISYGVWSIPVFMLYGAFNLKTDMLRRRVGQKFAFSAVCAIFISILVALIFIQKGQGADVFSDFGVYAEAAKSYQNGGIIGGILGLALYKITGKAAIFIAAFAVLILALFEFGCTPEDIAAYIRDRVRAHMHDVKNRKHEKYIPEVRPADPEPAEQPKTPKRVHTAYRCNRDLAYHLTGKNIDVDIGDKNTKKESVFDSIVGEDSELSKKMIQAENAANAERDIELIAGQGNTAEEFSDEDKAPFEETEVAGSNSAKSEAHVEGTDVSGIFADGAVIEAGGMAMNTSVLDGEVIDPSEGSEIVSEVSDSEQLEVHSGQLAVQSRPTLEELYTYPSEDLLTADPNPTTFTVTEELKATAVKLVDTLTNFGVRTKITNISCGPTVTRYELQPEVGVRVRSIQNLADDIALHLAASGVRIEAPIPGKDAVGIEIPNKTVSTVYIRNLIENPQFRNLKSRISVCLGMDVAGSPVYMDIAKMPHLLIAGATGMGKSVCINSFIISILYKARPDEVKFILIDPKKVEFSLYKGIPHLLVPVVNDPKKAAGALAWAVSEMERRFVLIEEVGVRDINGYNEATKNDPEKPRMSQIVIIIDELADLMMTARDEVENSICRLAQKARAAGMHIVIGTQRPSVDVITGLLKANIPSRIACTVASQVDSRTIIDISGAEKLIGKGDMLFAPVGCLKPIRVQGSFVSDSEVEAVTDFLRSNFTAEYDKSIIDDIEREAAKCGEKKKGKADAGDDADAPSGSGGLMESDEMIMPAIQVAVSAGQLSTSLLQRKLSLGYARAARIVDVLEQMGIVSGFEGSKPRRVLITEDQYLELKMRHENGGEQ